MGKTSIQWTSGPNGEPGYTFNPWIGCRKVAPECANCYAETLDKNRFSKTLGGTKEHPVSHWGNGPRHRTSASNWKQPLKWNREAAELQRLAGLNAPGLSQEGKDHYSRRPRVFCASLSDWLDDENVPIEWLADLLTLIHDTPHLDWLLLTKRPQNWRARLTAAANHAYNINSGVSTDIVGMMLGWLGLFDGAPAIPPANVWFGVSAGADQAAALDIPARVHFLSCEPMLRPMDTTHAARFDWIIFGGESGSKARPCNVDWILDGVNFCHQRGIATFVKQLGSKPFQEVESPMCDLHVLKDSHGGDMDEWPEDLRVREFTTPR